MISESLKTQGPIIKWSLTLLLIRGICCLAGPALAGEGGVTHVIPGAMATLSDLPPTSPGWLLKPMYLNYKGSFSAQLPTAAGIAGNVDVTTNTVGLVGGYTFGQTILGGAHYTFAAALPYSWVDISANVQTPFGTKRVQNSVSGFGDLTVLPIMLAWKLGDWQINATLPIYAPTGSYEKGRLGNTGLNYWTFDPIIGAVYSHKASGFNAMLHAGYAMNTENTATQYQSGSMMHLEGVIQQFLPVGPGILSLGVEGFYFDQLTGDSGSGATLGDFKGRTYGLGPVLGYILPLKNKQSLVFELKCLTELDTQRRLEGDYLWFKMVYKF
jgi:hypothetical protein